MTQEEPLRDIPPQSAQGTAPDIAEPEEALHPDDKAYKGALHTPVRGSWRSSLGWFVAILAVGFAFAVGLYVGTDNAPVSGGSGEHNHSAQQETWTCAMHPQIQNHEPGLCPICGMDLIVASSDDGDDNPAQITLSPRARRLAQIQTSPVRPYSGQTTAIRLLGKFEYDETKVRTVTAWTKGRIDKLHVATTGQVLKKGQSIAQVYSPEIYAAHQELLFARKQLVRLGDSGALPVARRSAQSTVEAARQRLRLLGVTQGQLQRMEKAKKPWQRVGVRTPFGGTVLERLVDEGQYVEAGSGIYKLGDLRSLWMQLDAYESDLPHLKVGQQVDLRLHVQWEQHIRGRVAFIDPVVNAHTRTARVRVEVPNPQGELRPGMFAEAVVYSQLYRANDPPLVIPDTAPLLTGQRALVYVELPKADKPTYEARQIRLGPRLGDVYIVVAGLEYGERVVTHGAFRLDADLQIKAGPSLMTLPDDRDPGRPLEPLVLSTHERQQLSPILSGYLDLQEALALDDLTSARQKAVFLGEALRDIDLQWSAPTVRGLWREMQRPLAVHSGFLAKAPDLDKARVAFDALTQPITRILKIFGNPLEESVHVAYCPMAFDNRGAYWVQRGQHIRNAFFGTAMNACGEVQIQVDSQSHAPAKILLAPAKLPASSPGSGPASFPASMSDSLPDSMPSSAPALPRKKRRVSPQTIERKPKATAPAKKPVSKPSSKAVTNPALQPASTSHSQPASKPRESPASGAATKPTSKPVSASTSKQGQEKAP